jgi:hypothetical protein
VVGAAVGAVSSSGSGSKKRARFIKASAAGRAQIYARPGPDWAFGGVPSSCQHNFAKNPVSLVPHPKKMY